MKKELAFHRQWSGAALGFALAILVGCSGSKRAESEHAAESSKDSTVHIGMLAPLTGAAARFGESQRNGVQLAINELNSKGGIQGRRVELSIEDTRSEPPTAVTAFTHVSARKDIIALFGSAASLDVPAYLPQVDAAGIPHVLPVAVLPKITEMGSRWTFRTALNDKIAASKMAEFVVRQLGAKKVALLIEDSDFGGTGIVFQQEAERLGVRPLAVERFRRGDLDLRPQLTKIRSLGATHIQFWGYYAEYALAAKQLRELGYQAVLMGNQAPVNDKTIELAGVALEGALNVCLFVPTSTSPDVRGFVGRYHAAFRSDPDTWAAQSYDAMMLLADALQRGAFTRSGTRDALSSTRDFRGVTGMISFLSSGDAEYRGTSIVRVANGRFVPYATPTKTSTP